VWVILYNTLCTVGTGRSTYATVLAQDLFMDCGQDAAPALRCIKWDRDSEIAECPVLSRPVLSCAIFYSVVLHCTAQCDACSHFGPSCPRSRTENWNYTGIALSLSLSLCVCITIPSVHCLSAIILRTRICIDRRICIYAVSASMLLHINQSISRTTHLFGQHKSSIWV
jgi:hypothetical protein